MCSRAIGLAWLALQCSAMPELTEKGFFHSASRPSMGALEQMLAASRAHAPRADPTPAAATPPTPATSPADGTASLSQATPVTASAVQLADVLAAARGIAVPPKTALTHGIPSAAALLKQLTRFDETPAPIVYTAEPTPFPTRPKWEPTSSRRRATPAPVPPATKAPKAGIAACRHSPAPTCVSHAHSWLFARHVCPCAAQAAAKPRWNTSDAWDVSPITTHAKVLQQKDFVTPAPVPHVPCNSPAVWSTWQPCSKSCGGGLQVRHARLNAHVLLGSALAPLYPYCEQQQNRSCNTQVCDRWEGNCIISHTAAKHCICPQLVVANVPDDVVQEVPDWRLVDHFEVVRDDGVLRRYDKSQQEGYASKVVGTLLNQRPVYKSSMPKCEGSRCMQYFMFFVENAEFAGWAIGKPCASPPARVCSPVL